MEDENGIAQHPDFKPPMLFQDGWQPSTLKIVSKESPLGFVVINASDFDDASMKLYADK